MEENVVAQPKEGILDWIKFIVKLVLICFIVNSSIGITKIVGHSMDPTLRNNSFILVNKLSTYFTKPDYKDVVIVDDGLGYDIIKRVIALPGDKVYIKDGLVYVNGNPLKETYTQGKSDDMNEVVVPEDNLFIMGDNRTPGESLDSRSNEIGTISIYNVKGYAVMSLIPMYKID